jgi:PTH1 family peptidyl-tRNA hydrolase
MSYRSSEASMLLLVGLGNPGPGYAGHRHNLGFMALDRVARRYGFAPWRARFHGRTAEGEIAGERILALKPETYMNDSGRAVAGAMQFYKLAPEAVVVVHDEVDLVPGKVRVKRGGGAGGHNGLRSIDAHIGSEYRRVRLGVGHPGHRDLVRHYLLHDFAKEELPFVDALLDAVTESMPLLVAGNDNAFMSKVDVTLHPPPPKPPRPPPQAEEPE